MIAGQYFGYQSVNPSNQPLIMLKNQSFFKRRKILKSANFLELHPIVRYQWEHTEEGLVNVLIPKFEEKFWYFLVPARHLKKNFNLNLDELGSATWKLMDGTKNVDEICQELSLHFHEKIHPAHERVTKYMSQLYQRDLITFNEILKK